LLPAPYLIKHALHIFVCLAKLVYGRSNLQISLRGFFTHWPSLGRL
jgi:hypothetical protein